MAIPRSVVEIAAWIPRRLARLLLCSDLRAQALLLRPELGRELGAEVLGLVDLTNLDLGLARKGVGAALDPFDGFFLRFHLPQPETGYELLRLGERTVDHRPLRAGE